MRESNSQRNYNELRADSESKEAAQPPRLVPGNELAFFESFYQANVIGPVVHDWMTLGAVTDPEARFHYNAVENSLIRALLRRSPPPPAKLANLWRLQQEKSGLRVLDVGSGTGHWVDFMCQVFLAQEVVAIEITLKMSAYLRAKYEADPKVKVMQADIAEDGFGPSVIEGEVDVVTAIGVMFHIVDDARWLCSLKNLAKCLTPRGLLLVGGDFGHVSRSVQFHRDDTFSTWSEYEDTPNAAGELRVNKRLRCLAEWQRASQLAGLEIIDLVRSDSDNAITVAENDVLVLARARGA
jgi:SAM-dependent methyltransferase